MLELLFIFYFKSFLSISDIQTLLSPLSDDTMGDDYSVSKLYAEMIHAGKGARGKLKKDLDESIEGKDVIIDCEKLEYIASSGLRILISILKGAKAGGSRVVMRKVNDDIMNVFRLTGFIDLFEFE